MKAKPKIAVDDRAVSTGLHEDGCSICKHPQRGAIERELTGWANISRLARQYHVNRGDIYRHANSFNLFSRHGRNVRRTLRRIIEYAEQVSLTAGPVVVTLEVCARINDSGHQQLKPSESSRNQKLFDRMTIPELEAYAVDGSLPDWFERAVGLAPAGSGER